MKNVLVGCAALGASSMFLFSLGCGAPAMPGGDGSNLLEDTAVGKAQCEDAATNQLRPFLVEWDATDLAAFESRASRDVIFVRYEGCDMTIIEGCSDGGIPGRYGKYRQPEFTSGTTEGISMQDKNELMANLPLGALEFGGHIKQDQQLDLVYHVTGTVTATRDAVKRAELTDNPECATATHFVWSYHLGAFDLSSGAKTEGDVSASYVGIGGEMKSATERTSLKQGGKLDSCDTHTQVGCRVPIRVVLRSIADAGPAASGGAAPIAAAPPPPPVDAPPGWSETPQGQAHALRDSATQKEKQGDGTGCLEDLDRAVKTYPQFDKDGYVLYVRSQCMMRVGKCDEGKKLADEWLRSQEFAKDYEEDQIELQVNSMANQKCPASQGATPEERITRANARIAEAKQAKNADACIEEAERIEPVIASIPKGPPTIQLTNLANGVVQQAALCAAEAGKCDDAWRLYNRYYDLQFAGTMPLAEVKSAAAQTFDAVAPKCKGKVNK